MCVVTIDIWKSVSFGQLIESLGGGLSVFDANDISLGVADNAGFAFLKLWNCVGVGGGGVLVEGGEGALNTTCGAVEFYCETEALVTIK